MQSLMDGCFLMEQFSTPGPSTLVIMVTVSKGWSFSIVGQMACGMAVPQLVAVSYPIINFNYYSLLISN